MSVEWMKRLAEALCGKKIMVEADGDTTPEAVCRACGVDPCPVYAHYLYAATHYNNPR
ncbi:MAG: hypothetical protein ABIJ47_07550 [Candidatus Bathyarchaeota archaeon]